MTNPAVSVVIAAHDGAAVIGDALASLTAQTFADFEVIVVDDGSTDATRDVVLAYPDERVRLIALEATSGRSRARNRGVAEARGTYIAGLDQNDLCRRDRLARQVVYLERHPRAVLVASAGTIVRDGIAQRSTLPATTTPALIGWLLRLFNPLLWSSVMLRADVAHELDSVARPELRFAEDFDLYHRVSHYGAIARIDTPLVTHRIASGAGNPHPGAAMVASMTALLERVYLPMLGDGAAEAAGLIARHVAVGVPVRDRETLRQLGALIAMLQSSYLDTGHCDRNDVALIRRETAQLWWRIARRAVRTGALSLDDALTVRPDHVDLDRVGLWSRVTGPTRAARRRLTR
jgi:glycosyltransferase involved in cell wall biosynthesis